MWYYNLHAEIGDGLITAPHGVRYFDWCPTGSGVWLKDTINQLDAVCLGKDMEHWKAEIMAVTADNLGPRCYWGECREGLNDIRELSDHMLKVHQGAGLTVHGQHPRPSCRYPSCGRSFTLKKEIERHIV